MNCATQIGRFLQNGHYFLLVFQYESGVHVNKDIRLLNEMNLFICVDQVWKLQRLHVFV